MNEPRSSSPGPHDNMIPLLWGDPYSPSTDCVVIFLHGRASSPDEDLPIFVPAFDVPGSNGKRVAAIALRAQDEVWYPNSWDAPLPSQEPYLTCALTLLDRTISSLLLPPSQVILVGFSQGSSILLTYALSSPRCYGGLVGLSGSIVGSPEDWPPPIGAEKGLNGTEVYLAWGSRDRYMSEERTAKEVKVFDERGGKVQLEIFEGMDHYVTKREVERLAELVKAVLGRVDEAKQ